MNKSNEKIIKTNYHTHTHLCKHARGNVLDYVEKAIDLGYEEIGISDHAPYPKADLRMSLDEYYNIYLLELEEAINKYSDKIKIYRGLEIEYAENMDDYYKLLLKDLDYLVLGQHFIHENGQYYDIYSNTSEQLILKYQNIVIKAMESGYFKIIAHPEIFMYRYRTWNKFTEEVSKKIIEAAIENNVLLEINANGIRRGKINNQDGEEVYIYPRIEFWRLVSGYKNVKVIINEDLHDYNLMDDENCLTARKFARKLNIKVETYLNKK